MRSVYFAIDDFIRLVKKRAPFAVPEHDVAHEKIAQERRADLAGKSAAAFPIHVLRAYFHVLRLSEQTRNSWDRGERRNDDDLHFAQVANLAQERCNKRFRLTLSHVHFPVSGNDFLSHESS